MNAERIKSIRRQGKAARGQKELIKHLSGERLTLKQAVNAHCYDCMGFFADGKTDCHMPACPLSQFMFYNKCRAKQTNTRTSSNAHMQKMRAARQKESNLLL
jgi:D-mannonate dehydratase